MKALIEVEVSDEFIAERTAQFNAEVELHERSTMTEYFLGRLRDVASDELPIALYGWPVEITVAPASE